VLLFIFVFRGVRSWDSALPERFDELVTLLVARKLVEGLVLFVGDDPADILV
jgi:hypothetical protein